MLATFLRRLAASGAAPKGYTAYRYQMRSLPEIASRLAGQAITLGTLFQQTTLLGRALVDDRGSVADLQLSRWTLAQRRSAVRSFATLMQPELQRLLGQDPHAVVDSALRCVAQRVGAGYRLSGGKPRKRGGHAPTATEVAAVIDAASHCPGFTGLRNAVFFRILAETGTRVNALRELDCGDCVAMPSGSFRLFVHAKGDDAAREVELGRDLSDRLREYADAFNRQSAVSGWRARIRLGEPGPLWRNGAHGRWSYRSITQILRAACAEVGVREFSPHALRRGFATRAATSLPRHVVALAGGWRGLERLDDYYIQTHEAHMRTKLEQAHDAAATWREDRPDADSTTVAPARRTSFGSSMPTR